MSQPLSVEWMGDGVRLIDQRLLPGRVEFIECRTLEPLEEAIRTLAVRGAPALGIAAAYGLVLAALSNPTLEGLEAAAVSIRATRPTAVNLFWAVDRMLDLVRRTGSVKVDALLAEAHAIRDEDEAMCRAIGRHGAALVKPGERILTHCNAGGLATGGYGTAVGVIRMAHEQGKNIHVVVDETRPLLQGARLTTWELKQDGIPFTLITDNMAGWLMKQGRISFCVVGADRIARNGDAANKIGTYSVAVLARAHGIPFYVAAPFSTIDLSIPSGEHIRIEERRADEVTCFGGVTVAPEGVCVSNPAFDVTPNEYITAIITERGVLYPSYEASLLKASQMPPVSAAAR